MLSISDFDKTLIYSAPHYYALLTTIDKNSKPDVMGISWFMLTSFSPLLLAISVGNTRCSYKNLKEIPEFGLCLPTPEITEKAMQCGFLSGFEVNKIKELKLEILSAQKIKPPLIKNSIVAYECEVVDSFATGDHTIFIGKIITCWVDINKEEHIFVKDGFSTPISLKFK